jgi:pilus assembly protein TadC
VIAGGGGPAVAAGCLAVAAGVVLAPTRPARQRLRALTPRSPVADGHRWLGDHRLGAVLGAIAAAVLVGGWVGMVVGLAVGVVLHRVLRRLEPRAVRTERMRAAADLPLAADLLAATLRAGAAVDRAAGAVGVALGGPLGERLQRVSRALRLGASAEEGWRHLHGVAGAERMRRAAERSASSGAALASALTRLADDLRAARLIEQDTAARRAGVLIVLPLGLCFLPAFVLTGLVPVIVAVFGDVL